MSFVAGIPSLSPVLLVFLDSLWCFLLSSFFLIFSFSQSYHACLLLTFSGSMWMLRFIYYFACLVAFSLFLSCCCLYMCGHPFHYFSFSSSFFSFCPSFLPFSASSKLFFPALAVVCTPPLSPSFPPLVVWRIHTCTHVWSKTVFFGSLVVVVVTLPKARRRS